MKKLGILLFLVAALVVLTVTYSGHEVPIYPSYYPQEIRIESIDPQAAGRLLREAKIHAYVGDEPASARAIPKSISYVDSLGSYLVLTLNPTSPLLIRDQTSGCSIASTVMQTLTGTNTEFIFHPYPVNPFHSDYLHHFDLANAAKEDYFNIPAVERGSALPELKVRTKGTLAKKLVPPRWQGGDREWDATLEQIDAGDLVASHMFNVNGWFGPPWAKEGWFHAYLLLAGTLSQPSARHRADRDLRRLQIGDYDGMVEKINTERELLSLLTRNCRRVIVGYTAKKEYFNSDYSAGIENIAFDSHAGLNSPIFIRTVKLKDLPWNGWLRLGLKDKPSAAWNPMGGFTDDIGRLIWFAVGDPAMFPEPYGANWTLNRIGDVQATLGRNNTDRKVP